MPNFNQASVNPPEPFLSAVIPVYNAEASLEPLIARLHEALLPLGDCEYIFVDDCSTDQSLAVLRRLAETKPWGERMKVVALGRNCGQQEAAFVGFSLAKGRYIASLDDDLQHPPELIPRMLGILQSEGFDIVYALPERVKEPLRRLGGALRDRLFAALFGGSCPVSSFRLFTRPLLNRVLQSRAGFFYFSAEVFSAPVKAGSLRYPYAARPLGVSGYSLGKRAGLYLRILRRYHPLLRRLFPPAIGRVSYSIKEEIHVEASDLRRLQLSDERLSPGAGMRR